eukprot:scaffold202545_cov36-Tisochrysis_lutea.AAC.1
MDSPSCFIRCFVSLALLVLGVSVRSAQRCSSRLVECDERVRARQAGTGRQAGMGRGMAVAQTWVELHIALAAREKPERQQKALRSSQSESQQVLLQR